MLELSIAFAAGLLAALVGSMSGGGAGIIQLAALLYLGLPIKSAVATHLFGDAGFYPTALRNLHKARQIKKRGLPLVIVLNLLATAGGTLLIVYINEDFLAHFIAFSLIIILFFTVRDRRDPDKERPSKPIWPLAYVAARFSAAAGFGNNLLAVLALIYLRGSTALQAVATAFTANGLSSLLAVSMLLSSGLIDFRLGVTLFVANLIGAQLGSRIAIKKGNRFVRYMIALVAVGVIIQLLFFRT